MSARTSSWWIFLKMLFLLHTVQSPWAFFCEQGGWAFRKEKKKKKKKKKNKRETTNKQIYRKKKKILLHRVKGLKNVFNLSPLSLLILLAPTPCETKILPNVAFWAVQSGMQHTPRALHFIIGEIFWPETFRQLPLRFIRLWSFFTNQKTLQHLARLSAVPANLRWQAPSIPLGVWQANSTFSISLGKHIVKPEHLIMYFLRIQNSLLKIFSFRHQSRPNIASAKTSLWKRHPYLVSFCHN